MAQKVTGIIKLQINAAKATASPPVGPALGQHGVNIAAFIKEFNARTKDQEVTALLFLHGYELVFLVVEFLQIPTVLP